MLAILPTATEEILEALPVESTLNELQQQKAERLAKSVAASDIASTNAPSAPPSVAAGEDDSGSASLTSDSYVHASQITSGNGASAGNGEGLLKERPRMSKAQLWNELKIGSIARAFTLLYILSLLTLLTRIQLNLLGRRNYLASVVSLAAPPAAADLQRINLENNDDDNYDHAYGNDFETNRQYLSFSWWLLHRGCKEIMAAVLEAVKEVFGPLNPREDVSLEKLSELTLAVRKKIEGATEAERRSKKWLSHLLPPEDQEAFVLRESGMTSSSPSAEDAPTSTPTPISPSLRRLLNETSDLIDSPSFTHVLTQLLDSSFSYLIDVKLTQQAYKIPPVSQSSSRITELVDPASAKCKLANTLAVFCRQAHGIGSGAENEYLAKMEEVGDLGAFAAVVYSSNWEAEEPVQEAQIDDPPPVTSRPMSGATQPDQNRWSLWSWATTAMAGSQGATPGATPAASNRVSGIGMTDVDEGSKKGVKGEESVKAAESSLEDAWEKALRKEDGKS